MSKSALYALGALALLALWAPMGGRSEYLGRDEDDDEELPDGECNAMGKPMNKPLNGMQRKIQLYVGNSARKIQKALEGMTNANARAIMSQWSGKVVWSPEVPTEVAVRFAARKGFKGCVYVNAAPDEEDDDELYETLNTQLFRALAQAAKRGGANYMDIYRWLLVQNRSWRGSLPVKKLSV